VAAQQWMAISDVLDDLEEREKRLAAVLLRRQEKNLREFRSLKSKVDALNALNKCSAKRSVRQSCDFTCQIFRECLDFCERSII
jgi:hypothetical protein